MSNGTLHCLFFPEQWWNITIEFDLSPGTEQHFESQQQSLVLLHPSGLIQMVPHLRSSKKQRIAPNNLGCQVLPRSTHSAPEQTTATYHIVPVSQSSEFMHISCTVDIISCKFRHCQAARCTVHQLFTSPLPHHPKRQATEAAHQGSNALRQIHISDQSIQNPMDIP